LCPVVLVAALVEPLVRVVERPVQGFLDLLVLTKLVDAVLEVVEALVGRRQRCLLFAHAQRCTHAVGSSSPVWRWTSGTSILTPSWNSRRGWTTPAPRSRSRGTRLSLPPRSTTCRRPER